MLAEKFVSSLSSIMCLTCFTCFARVPAKHTLSLSPLLRDDDDNDDTRKVFQPFSIYISLKNLIQSFASDKNLYIVTHGKFDRDARNRWACNRSASWTANQGHFHFRPPQSFRESMRVRRRMLYIASTTWQCLWGTTVLPVSHKYMFLWPSYLTKLFFGRHRVQCKCIR